MNRATFYDIENLCQHYFEKFGCVYHLCTPENHPLVFHNDAEFKTGMNLIGIVAKAHPEIQVLTFELMNNHLHIIIAGKREFIAEFFECLRKLMGRCLSHDMHPIDLSGFTMQLHEIKTLENLRNAIAYANRNGSIADRHVCPYTYPWGANRYFFNNEAKSRYMEQRKKVSTRQVRSLTQSRKHDNVSDLYMVDDYICPLSFCAIDDAENLFLDARHYFTKVSRHIESYDEIAKMIGEQVYYTDDDLFAIACTLSSKKYDCRIPSQLQKDEKLELARHLNREYNAGVKQLQRMLKMDMSILTAIFGSSSK